MGKKVIDEHYFKNYAGRGQSYDKVYRDHTSVDDCIALFEAEDAPHIRSICVLGTATGEVLKDLYKGFGLKPYGCEISEWACQRLPSKFAGRIECADMRDYVQDKLQAGKKFDLCFSNSFVYLKPSDLPSFLNHVARLCKFLHFDSSFTGDACPDPYRQTLKSYKWWTQQLHQAGFQELTTIFEKRTYLWKSRYFYNQK